MQQVNCYQQYNQEVELQKNRHISKNYLAIYQQLLLDDRYIDKTTGQCMVPCKEPFYIEKKDVYALSDIEGNNLVF